VNNPAIQIEEYFHNSIFRKYWLQFSELTSRVQCNFIYPATDMLVKKYSKQQMYTVRETADVYKRVTKAQYLDSLDMSHCDWMYNVLDNKKEQELTVFENEHFKLQKDFKFNEGDLSTLYLLAIPTTRTLKSVRDLSADHLPMLKSILAESYKVIETKFKVP
jgi:m7GpppX diphosphatase